MDCRLRLNNEPAHQHTNGNDDPVIGQGGQLPAQICTRRQKAYIHACQEQYQANISIQKACYDFQHLFPLQA